MLLTPFSFRKLGKGLFAFLPLLLLTIVCALPVSAASPTVVRIGFPQQAGLTEIDENGVYSGYTYDYLMELAQYTGWEYEFFVPDGKSTDENLGIVMEMLEKGELDLVGSMRKTDALEEIYGYAAYHYGTSSATLSVLDGNTSVNPSNYYSKKNLRVAVLEKATRQNGLLDQFCKLNNFSPILVQAENDREQSRLLREGKADLALGRDLSPIEGTAVIAKFAPEPFFFASTKNNTSLLNQLNYALLKIEELNPGFSTSAYDEYFSHPTSTQLSLSETEKRYIEASGVITVGLTPDRSPIQSFDFKTGEASGIMVDLLQEVSAKTGLMFQYESAKTPDEFARMAMQNRFALIAGIDYNYNLANACNVIMTPPVFSVPYVRIENTARESKTAALGFPQRMKYIQGLENSGVPAVFYPTSIEAVKAVERGELEAAYMDFYVAQRLLNEGGYTGLLLSSTPKDMAEICVGIDKQQSRLLVSIVSKALQALSEQDISDSVYKNTLYAQTMTLHRIIALYPLQSLSLTALVLLFVIWALAFYLKRTTRLKNRVEANNKRYLQLCELVGEVICEYDYNADTLTVSGAHSRHLFEGNAYHGFLAIYSAGEAEYPPIEQVLARLITARSAGEINRLCALPSGDTRWLCVNHELVEDADGKPDFLICKITDVNDSMRELKKLTQKAQTDTLTGLYNLDTFRALVCESMACENAPAGGVFLIMDVDNFKGVNDRFGHFEGDEVLKGIACALRAAFRESDFVGRLGGDEFVAFSPNLTDSAIIAQKCRSIMARCGSISDKLPVTVSIGVVRFHASVDFDALYKQADSSLYRVKQAGRNGYDICTLDGEAKG